MKYPIKKLSEICDITIGRTPARKNHEYWGKGNKWAAISDLTSKLICKTKEEITDYAVAQSRCRKVPKGTLLFSFKLTIGKMAFAGCDLYTNEAIAALHIKHQEELYSEYLFYALQVARLLGSNQAVMGKTLNSKSLAQIKIPLPSLDDQIRIAHLLGKVEGLIARRKQHLQQLDELLKSVFLEMFGDPVRNEKGWETAQLVELTRFITDGKHGDCNNDENSGYYFISAKDIHDGIIDYSQARQIVKEEFEEVHRRTDLKPNDLVMVNTGATIGKMAIVRSDQRTQKTTFQKSVAVIKPNHAILNVFYLKALFEIRLRELVKVSSGSAQQNLLLSQMRKIPVVLPSIDLQNQFATIVEKVEGIKTQYQQSLTELENLYGALSQRAFKGELDLSRVSLIKKERDEQQGKESDVKAEEMTEEETRSIELPEPADLGSLAKMTGRRDAIENWLASYLEQLDGKAFDVGQFMQLAQLKLDELIEDETPELGVDEYNWIKKRVFHLLENGQMTQAYDDDKNRVLIKGQGDNQS